MLPVSGKTCDHCAKRHFADLVRSAKTDVPLSDTTPLSHKTQMIIMQNTDELGVHAVQE